VSKEFYGQQPKAVEVFVIGKTSDIILRQNIQQTEVQSQSAGEKECELRWECDEAQTRYDGVVTADAVARQFGYWWSVATKSADDAVTAKRKAKLEELSAVCHATILNGVDVQLSDGDYHHFSLEAEDQSNIDSMFMAVVLGATCYTYHADGESCREFSREDIVLLYVAYKSMITQQTAYYNALKAWVERSDPSTLTQIIYGCALPDELNTQYINTLTSANQQIQTIVGGLTV